MNKLVKSKNKNKNNKLMIWLKNRKNVIKRNISRQHIIGDSEINHIPYLKSVKLKKSKPDIEQIDFVATNGKPIQQTSLNNMIKNVDDNILTKVSKLMMNINSIKQFHEKYMKLGPISRGANGIIYAVKSWQTKQFYAMKQISFKYLPINVLYEVLTNWIMVKRLQLIGEETEIYIDSKNCQLMIVLHLFKGSLCDLLQLLYLKQQRPCGLKENQLKDILKNGVLHTLDTLHSNGYIHGDIKLENIVYEYNKNKLINTAIIDYDQCILCTNGAAFSEWRGTIGYTAPEWTPYQSVKSHVTTKVDIFSLGLTMLIILSGTSPFLCPTTIQNRLKKENPNINIKKLIFETMINDGEWMIKNYLETLLNSDTISCDLYNLLKSMLIYDPSKRYNVQQIMKHKWFY